MNSEALLLGFLETVKQDPLVTGLVALVVILIVQVVLLTLKVERLLKGGDGKSLEGTINALGSRTQALESHASKTTALLKNHEMRITRSVQGVKVVRFDPFRGAGGQQSFATALLNEQGDGVVVSGIHSRDGVRVYAKEVKSFLSERELSDEERSAIAEAKSKL